MSAKQLRRGVIAARYARETSRSVLGTRRELTRSSSHGTVSAVAGHSWGLGHAVPGFAAPPSDGGGAAPVGEPAEEVQLPRGNGELILVVDDEEWVLEMTCTVLRRFGYRVESATGGDDALRLFTQQPQPGYRLIITDLSMPRGDGARLIERVREIDRQTPIVVMSAYFDAGELGVFPEEAIQGKLAKPYTVVQLLVAAARALEGIDGAAP